jgi:hypothetical protein
MAIAGLTLFFTSRANAQVVTFGPHGWNFDGPLNTWWENGLATWFPGGNAGKDTNGCCSFQGSGNLWARNNASGVWNSVNVGFGTLGGSQGGIVTTCDFSAEVRTDPGFNADAQMDVWVVNTNGTLGRLLAAEPLPISSSYFPANFTNINVTPAEAQSDVVLLVYGFHSNGVDHWMQVDNVEVTCFDCNNPLGCG